MITFQESIRQLHTFWAERGCSILEGWDVEKGAATLGPQTFLRSLEPRPWRVAYVDACRRPTDSRHGQPTVDRWQRYYQYQILLKPTLDEDAAQRVFLDSLLALGLDLKAHPVTFGDDAWESPVFGARGAGWEVWVDGVEIAQLTWFDEVGGIACPDRPLEITYGLERLNGVLQGISSFAELRWDGHLTYGDLHLQHEQQYCVYNLEAANSSLLRQRLELYASEVEILTSQSLVHPALDVLLKWAQTFNTLDARQVFSVEERAALIQRSRALATAIGQRHKMSFQANAQ